MVVALVLAAGCSKRMGMEKMLLPYKGTTLLNHTLRQIKAAITSPIVVVTKKEIQPSIKDNERISCCINLWPEVGQAESIKIGIRYIMKAFPKCKGVLIFLGDQPQIDCKASLQVMRAVERDPNGIVICHYNGKKGHPTGFGNKWFEALLQLEGDTGGREIIRHHQDQIVMINGSKAVVSDIDTPDDYEKLLKQENKSESFSDCPWRR